MVAMKHPTKFPTLCLHSYESDDSVSHDREAQRDPDKGRGLEKGIGDPTEPKGGPGRPSGAKFKPRHVADHGSM